LLKKTHLGGAYAIKPGNSPTLVKFSGAAGGSAPFGTRNTSMLSARCRSDRTMPRSFPIYDILLLTTDIRDARSCPKVSRNFDVLEPPFLERAHPNLWPIFINLGHHRTCGKVWRLSGQAQLI